MIASKRVPWKELTFDLDPETGKIIKIYWNCPYCKKENEDFECRCGAWIPEMEVKKDYTVIPRSYYKC